MTNYNYTGSPQSFVVPAGAVSVKIEAWGGSGLYSSPHHVSPGRGGYATGFLAVTPGEVLTVVIGPPAGGGAGGGAGGASADVRQGGTELVHRKIVAGGGGGSGYDGGAGGDGGGLVGAGALGGTQSAPGAAGTGSGGGGVGGNGQAGFQGEGGGGGLTPYGVFGGGGGGDGYFGGGGGGWGESGGNLFGGGGGGGSSYIGGVVSGSTTVGIYGDARVVITVTNTAPNAPTLVTMADGATVDRGTIQRARHTFSDPDPFDSQSAFDLRYRITGTSTWTTINRTTPNPWHDFAAGALAAGAYERQVRTYDAAGNVSPWSASGFFTAATVPDGPSITYPTNGQTVEQAENVVWSTPDQDAYQVRRLADAAGTPNTGVVYFDTGEVTNPATRSLALDFATNSRTEHVQVRVKNDGLWSPWATVQVAVSYTPPPVPTFVLYPDPATASFQVSVTNPAPTGGDPAAIYNDIWVDDGNGPERKATQLPTNTVWRYWTPRSGRDYTFAIQVVAVAANGVTSTSTGGL